MTNKDLIIAILRSKAFVLAMLTLIGYIVFAQVATNAANNRAKNTYLKKFYAQAQLADEHIQELDYSNFVAQAPVDGSQTGKRGITPIKYCSGPGSYHNYVTGKTINNARTCQKGTIKFYWLPTLDSATIDAQIADLKEHGWTPIDQEADMQLQMRNILVRHESNRGFMFTRSDGTQAYLTFWNRKGQDASNGRGWCEYLPICDKVKAADSTHQYFVSVSIYAYKGYED